MKDNELITRKNIELALLNKGQHSRRYNLGDIWELDYGEIREVLDDVDADVKPVVRCKDCVYWSSKETRYCNMLQGTFRENDYCSYGERKGADGEVN